MFVLDTFAAPQLFVFGQFYALEKQACFYFSFSKLFMIILSCVFAFADVCDYRKHFFPKYTHSFLFICGIIFSCFLILLEGQKAHQQFSVCLQRLAGSSFFSRVKICVTVGVLSISKCVWCMDTSACVYV